MTARYSLRGSTSAVKFGGLYIYDMWLTLEVVKLRCYGPAFIPGICPEITARQMLYNLATDGTALDMITSTLSHCFVE